VRIECAAVPAALRHGAKLAEDESVAGHAMLLGPGTDLVEAGSESVFVQPPAGRLRQKYIKDAKVTVEVAIYRPFFILGEVNTPGQYPYVNAMTVEAAVAIAEGYTERA